MSRASDLETTCGGAIIEAALQLKANSYSDNQEDFSTDLSRASSCGGSMPLLLQKIPGKETLTHVPRSSPGPERCSGSLGSPWLTHSLHPCGSRREDNSRFFKAK